MQLSPTSNWRPTLDEHHESLTRAANAAARMVADAEAGLPPYWLTLTGVPGTGKTMIARQTYERLCKLTALATANHPQQVGVFDERRRRPGNRWIDAIKFKELYLGDRQWDLPEHLSVEWLLGFDDLGAGNDPGGTVAEAFYRLANGRLGRWTVWTTNLTLDELARKIDPRVSSRLIRDDNRLVTITAGDYATRAKKK